MEMLQNIVQISHTKVHYQPVNEGSIVLCCILREVCEIEQQFSILDWLLITMGRLELLFISERAISIIR